MRENAGLLGVEGADLCGAGGGFFVGVEYVEKTLVAGHGALRADDVASVGEPGGFYEITTNGAVGCVLGRDKTGLASGEVVHAYGFVGGENNEVFPDATPVRLGTVDSACVEPDGRAAAGVHDVELRAGRHGKDQAPSVGRETGGGFCLGIAGDAGGTGAGVGGADVDVDVAAGNANDHRHAGAVGAVAPAHVGAVVGGVIGDGEGVDVDLENVGGVGFEKAGEDDAAPVGRPVGADGVGAEVGDGAGLVEEEVADVELVCAGVVADKGEARGEEAGGAGDVFHGGVGGAEEGVAGVGAVGCDDGGGGGIFFGDFDADLGGGDRGEGERVVAGGGDAREGAVGGEGFAGVGGEPGVAGDDDGDGGFFQRVEIVGDDGLRGACLRGGGGGGGDEEREGEGERGGGGGRGGGDGREKCGFVFHGKMSWPARGAEAGGGRRAGGGSMRWICFRV